MNDQEHESRFKVVDRRRVNELGESLDNSDENKPVPPKSEPKQTASEQKTTEERQMTFSMFIQSLAHQAMMGLGLTPWPDSGLIKLELSMAKETIDMLRLLQEKTVNNLDQKEQTLLNTLLYQLQVAFVDANKVKSANSSIVP